MDQLRNAQGNMHYLFRPGGFFIQARNPSHQVRKSPPNFLMRQARKKLYIGHSHRYDLCAQDPMLPDRTVKTILKKFLAKNPTTTIPVSAEYSLRRKQLSKYVKKAIFVPKLYKIFAQFEEIVFDRADFRRLGRVVSESKYIKSLTLADIQNVPLSCIKQTKKLTNLDSLVLLVKTVWFEKCSVPLNFTRLRKLKKLALKLDSSGFLNVIDQNKFISNFSNFCQNLSKCHQLEKLEIELSAQDDTVLHSVKTLLTSLDVLKIDSFNLVLYCGISLSLEISTIKNLLGKVDYLGFHYQKPSAIKDEKKYSKSLKFICPENMVGLGINEIMKSCQILATLSLEIPISAMYFPSKLILPKNLKRLYIRFDKERDYEMLKEIKLWSNILKKIPCLEEFGISMLDWRFESYPELVKLHEIDCLRNLKSYSIYITNRQGFIIRDILSDLAEIVEPIKTVETWQFAFDKVVNELEELKFWKMLYGKENMKNLLIRIPKGILDNNVDFPFKKLRPLQQLEKLEIELDEWKKSDVLKKLPALPNIKDLKIYGRKWSIDMIEYDRLRKALLA